MRNNPAYLRVLAYIDTNNVTKAQIMAATAAQVRGIMWPDTDGVKPEGEHATPVLVRRALAHEYRERLESKTRQDVVDNVGAAIGRIIELVEAQGERRYLVTFGEVV